jgi:hypothetical protein
VTPEGQCRLIVAALEVALGPALQPLNKGTQDHGSPPTSEVHIGPASSRRGKRHQLVTSPAKVRSYGPRIFAAEGPNEFTDAAMAPDAD